MFEATISVRDGEQEQNGIVDHYAVWVQACQKIITLGRLTMKITNITSHDKYLLYGMLPTMQLQHSNRQIAPSLEEKKPVSLVLILGSRQIDSMQGSWIAIVYKCACA